MGFLGLKSGLTPILHVTSAGAFDFLFDLLLAGMAMPMKREGRPMAGAGHCEAGVWKYGTGLGTGLGTGRRMRQGKRR